MIQQFVVYYGYLLKCIEHFFEAVDLTLRLDVFPTNHRQESLNEAAMASEENDPEFDNLKKKIQKALLQELLSSLNEIDSAKTPTERGEKVNIFFTLADAGVKTMQIVQGSIILFLELESRASLVFLWHLYKTGTLHNMIKKSFITKDFLSLCGVEEIKLSLVIQEEDYRHCLSMFGTPTGNVHIYL